MKIGNRTFENYTYVMAIINLTPDSFWSASRHTADDVLFAVDRAVRQGASVIDLGAQSTRPGYGEVGAEEEIRRFEIPLRLVKERFDIPVSVDTYFSRSARAALELGADMINDATIKWQLLLRSSKLPPVLCTMRRPLSAATSGSP